MAIAREPKVALDNVWDWLRKEAKARNIKAIINPGRAKIEEPLITLPVFIEGDLDAYDNATLLQDLEDSWNNREPKPYWLLFLMPSGKP